MNRRHPPTPMIHPTSYREPSTALKQILQEELTAIIADKNFGPASLQMAQRFAQHSQQLLATLDPRLNAIDPYSAGSDCGVPGFSSIGPMGSYSPYPLAPSSSSETYGAALSRELVAAVGKLKDANNSSNQADPVALVEAVAVAREKGLNDLADRLEAQVLDLAAPGHVETSDPATAASTGPIPAPLNASEVA